MSDLLVRRGNEWRYWKNGVLLENTKPDPDINNGDPLPYAPPSMMPKVEPINNQSGEVINGVRTLKLTAGVDYELVMQEPITHRLRVANMRNFVLIGGEWDINVENASAGATNASAYDADVGFEPWNVTGIGHIEGVKVHGAYATDSIRSGAVTNAKLQIQNCLLKCDRLIENVTGPSDKVFHTDGLQFWDGIADLKVHNCTIYNPYQGGMIGDGDLTNGPWKTTKYSRVNFRPGETVGQAWKIINFTGDGDAPTNFQGPLTFEDCYYEIGSNVTWANGPTNLGEPSGTPGSGFVGAAFYSHMIIGTDAEGYQTARLDRTKVPNSAISAYSGVFRRGLPPDGDYVKTNVGMNYKSPGYQS